LKVLRIYHSGRSSAHRERERQLAAAGVQVTLVVPEAWPDEGSDERLPPESFTTHELAVRRAGDVNRHAYVDAARLESMIAQVSPELLDVHEEPFSLVTHQVLRATSPDLPVVMYTAQNVDKRFPPPFAQYETAAYRRASAMYPCSVQAAAVARGKGFGGMIEVLPLGYDDSLFVPGTQSADDDELVLGFVGRLVPEKGLLDAVRLLERLNQVRPARLLVSGAGPDGERAQMLASKLGVGERLELLKWASEVELAAAYRTTHVLLVPSRPTATWVEQFGRVIVEGQASGAVVAGYDSGTIREVGGEAAVLAPVGVLDGLARAVIELVSDAMDFSRRREVGFAINATRTWRAVAARQAALYRRVIAGDTPGVALPASPRARRALARAEFGPSAATTAGERPFAVPVLRKGGAIPHALGAALDAGAEVAAQARQRRRHHR
jgi:glycosyltransferase involved in cell wall biosynthesis